MFALLGSRRRVGVGIAALSAAMLLTGCAAGQKAATADEKPVLDGTTARIGSCKVSEPCINLDALSVAPPMNGTLYAKGGQATLRLIVANSSEVGDELTSVTTSAATSTSLVASLSSVSATPCPSPSVSPSPSPASASASPSASASAASPAGESSATESAAKSTAGKSSISKSPTPTPCVAPEPQKLSTIDIGAGERVSLGFASTDAAIVLSGLTEDLYPAQSVDVTFTFAKAGAATVAVPVHLIAPASNPPSVDVAPPSE